MVPFDDTIPQIGEGALFITANSFTPTCAAHLIEVAAAGWFSNSVANGVVFSVYRDSTADAVMSVAREFAGGNSFSSIEAIFLSTALSTAPTVFTARAGARAASTTTFNGTVGARLFGGAVKSYIKLQELVT